MKVIARGRLEGKTSEIVKQFIKCFEAGEKCELLVMNEQEKGRIIAEYKLTDKVVFCISSFQRSHPKESLCGKGSDTKIFIDNADYLIQQLYNPFTVAAISVNAEAEK